MLLSSNSKWASIFFSSKAFLELKTLNYDMKKKLIWFNLLLLCSFESILNLVSGIPKIAGRLFYYTLNVNTGHHRHCYLTFLLHFCFLRQTVGGADGKSGESYWWWHIQSSLAGWCDYIVSILKADRTPLLPPLNVCACKNIYWLVASAWHSSHTGCYLILLLLQSL